MTYTYKDVIGTIFTRKVENGTPDDISKAGCIALARLGKDAWNLWRASHPTRPMKNGFGFLEDGAFSENRANFDGAIINLGSDDHGIDEIDFSGFNFGNGASFKEADLYDINFKGCTFGKGTSFQGTKFKGSTTIFTGAFFDEDATFYNAIFSTSFINFAGAVFLRSAVFNRAKFGLNSFSSIGYPTNVIFSGTIFGPHTSFNDAQFHCEMNFEGNSWSELEQKYGQTFSECKQHAEANEFSTKSFEFINFAGATFYSKVSFRGRDFRWGANFSQTKYFEDSTTLEIFRDRYFFTSSRNATKFISAVPDFHGCTFQQVVNFEKTIFPKATGDYESILAYTTLRQLFSQKQHVRNEQLFFKLEMKEEAKSEKTKKNYLTASAYYLYSFFADYGFSVLRPLIAFILLPLIFFAFYGIVAGLPIWHPFSSDSSLNSELLNYVVINVSPFPIDKSELPIVKGLEGLDRVKWTLLLVIEKIISALLIFLTGLALRNLFKMK